ncbi:endonuclease [Rhizobium pusense]|uniref:endonuclease n=1 Tax=Agrobacterium pusense TaxID=648995 RepID=UPI0024472E18|nr:endonuclease [Agrobacterium pusense]MDH2092688.1 endonuclease [Agrobacterium pusense]
MRTAEIFLPWPDKRLSPNSRYHWAQVARAKKAAKRTAHYTVLEAGIGKINATAINVKLSFYPPSKRHYDADNLIASHKAALDGISDAIGIDDRKFIISATPHGPVGKNGMVKVSLSWEDASEVAA